MPGSRLVKVSSSLSVPESKVSTLPASSSQVISATVTPYPANDRKITTFGVAYKPIPQAVLKVDYQNVGNAAGTGVDQINIALGYLF